MITYATAYALAQHIAFNAVLDVAADDAVTELEEDLAAAGWTPRVVTLAELLDRVPDGP